MAKNETLFNLPELVYIWQDRKRFLGMPLSFTKYLLSDNRLFLEVGLFSTKHDEVLLYRVRDISISQNLIQKICRVGTVIVESTDSSMPLFELKNVKHPREVKELIHQNVERAKISYRVRVSELVGVDSHDCDHDGSSFNNDNEAIY